jgi:SulP family sulfate permease
MALNFSAIFRPRLIDSLRGYTSRDLMADVTAGVTVGIVALPLAMAFAIASGVRPEVGLFTAIVAGFLISALGGSRVQIGGPTGAFVAIVYSIVVTYGLGNLLICTVMAGLMLIVMGLTRMGSMIRYIPYPITTGFTSGIAVLIFSTQIKDFFGLMIEKVPAEFVARMFALLENAWTVHWPTVALAAASLAIIILWPKPLGKYLPGSIVAMVAGTLAVILFHLPVETIGAGHAGRRSHPARWP